MFTFTHKPSKKVSSKGGGGSSSSEDLAASGGRSSPSECGSMSSAQGFPPLMNAGNAFVDMNEQTCVKESGQLNGLQFTIRGCTSSVLALLDYVSSVIIEDCNNCIFICGPSRGSVFMRNCTNCLLLAACYQFRATNCNEIEAHLHTTTQPTIEDTDLIVAPLLMSYQEMDAHMAAAGLDRTKNLWKEVRNFTPDTGNFHTMPFDPFGNGAIACEVVTDELLERLSTFMEQECAHELLLGPS
ncbi:hypothetical protein ACQ4LE_001974 [Meloidogyne hapla]|uniref:C-CAP/cofactor C-like domain-containing protein n=1 Tax=Meloidogyne hapla TaxID=6305 RepID=A0A1I8BM02_MELHA